MAAELVFGAYLVQKKKTKSVVWKNFGLRASREGVIVDKEQDKPVCRTCGRSVQAKGSNTTNLYQHLREHHPTIYAELAPKVTPKQPTTSQASLAEVITRATKFASTSAQAKEFNRAVTYYLAKDAVPISTVDKPGFRHLVSVLNPRYQLPSRKHFSDQEIPQLYTHVRDTVVMPALREAEFFSATTDLWTSAASEPYMTLTVHYVDKAWNLRSFCLETVPMFVDHTGKNIADAVSDIFDNWGLSTENVVAFTTDSGSNVISAFNSLNLLRISCFGHNLDLAIKKSLATSQVQQSLARCHSLVELFHRSWKKTRDLREKQQLLGLPQHKLMGDVPTRWGSTYDMVSRIVEQQQALSLVLAEDRKNWYRMPTDKEFSVLETIVAVLKPLSYLTDALSGEKEVTASAVIPLLKHVKTKCSSADDATALAKEMQKTIWSDIEHRYRSTVLETLSTSTFLDPRFKDQYLEDKEESLLTIKRKCLALNLEISTSSSLSGTDNTQSSQAGEAQPPPKKRLKGLAAVLESISEEEGTASTQVTLTTDEKIDKEMYSYLDIPLAPSDTDPLVWWQTENERFPHLAQLAKKYLCICGTSVPSERVFSTAGNISSDSRCRLLPQNVNKLVFLAKNMK